MENVLIVAENEELAEILVNYLNSNNFNAHAASCLIDAQEKLRETQYDLVIADLPSMKTPDLELCHRIRSVDQNLPLLFMCDIEGNFFTGFHLQFVEYIIKPFRKDEFNRKIRTLMGDSIKKQIVVPA
ncbi:response regulator transcription factor [Peredibacter starrii]|uniref:Response regulator n=1 Tax=Peredibacter starrii TaxID=28202 RepID=A0AAX4HTY3_9BACT|nr:response regulator [Peredibacter starrii]WPU66846.1 response regulator [Peredibacter starrii]